jgi:HPt (histidine-containing phosphotransfer) domain-containing protein
MYCIINQNKDIIAGDKEFFTLLHTESLMELYGQIANEDISVSFGLDNITIVRLDDATSYPVRMFELSGLLSQANIIEILPQEQGDTDIDYSSESLHAEEDKLQEHTELTLDEVKPLEHTELTLEEDKPLEHIIIPTFVENGSISNDENVNNLTSESLSLDEESLSKPINVFKEQTISIEIPPRKNDETLSIYDATQDIQIQKSGSSNDDIEIDVPSISKKIGLSQADYSSFLQEYMQTAQSLKTDLESSDEDKKQLAINFIAHLSDVLCLPTNISDVVSTLSSTPTPENIDKFYNVIAKIKVNNQEPEVPQTIEASQIEEAVEVKEIEIKAQSEIAPKKIRSINLSDIAPVKFDFILDEAVRELSLPSDIVKEFITYFIEQSHIEIETILDAYEAGDVEKVKRTAHLLKGVASNLYIVPLAESLFELQYNEDIEQVEPLVKKYWAQFISFENLMNNA